MTESTSPNILLIFSVATSLMIFMAGVIIFFVIYYQKRMLQNKMEQQAQEGEYQKELLKTTIESQEVERKRIASELHDGVGALLSAARLNLNFLKTSKEDQDAKEAVVEMKEMIDETIDTVRRISKDLLPASLEKFGLEEAIKEFCEKVSTKNTQVTFQEVSGEFLLIKENELPIYRLVQEIVNNAIKHANASTIGIRLDLGSSLNLSIHDDGVGFDVEEIRNDITKGVGLYNIENRVHMLGGVVTLESKIGVGTSYKIVIEHE